MLLSLRYIFFNEFHAGGATGGKLVEYKRDIIILRLYIVNQHSANKWI